MHFKRTGLGVGMAHFLMDATSAWILFGHLEPTTAAFSFVIYNLLAFAFQPGLGYAVDRWNAATQALLGSFVLLLLAIISLGQIPFELTILITALASGLFHVSAGSLVLNRESPLIEAGLFTAPGVLGLAIGTAAAITHWPLQLVFVIALCFMILVLRVYLRPAPVIDLQDMARSSPGLLSQDTRDLLLLITLSAIALRSAFWNLYQLLIFAQIQGVLALGIGAFSGKLLGGALAQRYGIRPVALGSLVIALPCLALAENQILFLALGVAALQASTPLTLVLVGRLMPRRKATAAGLALGFALAVGGVLALKGRLLPLNVPVISFLVLALGLLLWLSTRRTLPDISNVPGKLEVY